MLFCFVFYNFNTKVHNMFLSFSTSYRILDDHVKKWKWDALYKTHKNNTFELILLHEICTLSNCVFREFVYWNNDPNYNYCIHWKTTKTIKWHIGRWNKFPLLLYMSMYWHSKYWKQNCNRRTQQINIKCIIHLLHT